MTRIIASWILVIKPIVASEAPASLDSDKTAWIGEVEVGMVISSGNSDTRNITAKAEAHYIVRKWTHNLRAQALNASDSGETSAERYSGGYKADYTLNQVSYIFSSFRGESDRFSGFNYRFSASPGYGRKLIQTDTVKLDVEAGPGLRYTKFVDERTETDPILRGALVYKQQILPTTRLSQDLLIQTGSNNTQVESITAMSVKMNQHFALKFSFTALHNTNAPTDRKNTDTLTSVALSYEF